MSFFDLATASDRELSIDTLTDDHSETTESSGSLPARKTTRIRSAQTTWEHSRDAIGDEPERGGKRNDKMYYCKRCIDTPYSTYVSTTFRNHLSKAHQVEVVTQTVHPLKKARTSLLRDVFAKAGSGIMKLDGHEEQVLRKALNPKAILEALVQLVTVRNLPYNCSQWPELHALLMAVNYTAENVISLSHGEVQKLVSNSYFIHKEILRNKLQSSLSKLHLSADVWTAPNHKSFLGTCVQFIEEDKKETRQALLALSELPGLDGPGSHGGAEQWKLLRSVLEDYKIWGKIGYFTGDNHGSNDVLCAALGNFLEEEKGITWQPKHRRIRCHGHVINLIVQAFLFMESKEAVDAACKEIEELDEASYDMDMIQAWKKHRDLGWREMGALGKVHNTALHIRADNFRYSEFKKRAGRVLPLDNDTRWNSWFHLLETMLGKQDQVKWYQEKHYDAIKENFLSIEDWKTLCDTCDFLQPFWRITQITESHKTTLDSTLFTMDVLRKHFEHAIIKHKDHKHLLGCILTSWQVFAKYYRLSDDNPVYAAALILHPSRRKAHIQKNWQKSWHKKAFNSVKKLWEDEYKGMVMIDDPSLIITDQEPDGYDLLARELDVVGGTLTIDEYETFTSQNPITIDCSPLTWWLRDEQQGHYPNLSKMAINILSIPAMSADPERVFSGARRTISWDRMLLGADTIEKGECLKSWIRSGITRGLPAEILDEYLDSEVRQENL
jgi:hypothetical protein